MKVLWSYSYHGWLFFDGFILISTKLLLQGCLATQYYVTSVGMKFFGKSSSSPCELEQLSNHTFQQLPPPAQEL